MREQDRIYFENLTKDRAESADMLEKPSMRGIKRSVVDKYSDQAHFIYELLQNADDTGATSARFVLHRDKLVFAHNGTRHFSVSNPETEGIDSENGTLGDVNAITAIANSNKKEASIGKFGVGFKAVFQYTSTPHIYDPNFGFKIERFIVPTLLQEDFPDRQAEETLFVFPFDHPEHSEEEAYGDISDKLKNLSFPLLFLSRLQKIEFTFDGIIGRYGKSVKDIYEFDDVIAEQICLNQSYGDEISNDDLWLFSKKDEHSRKYSVGFFMDEEGNLRPVNEPAFCFFPTKEVTGLNFIVHAPFLLTDSREGIRAGVNHNDEMIQKLSILAADALVYLRDIGNKKNCRLLDDNIVSIIPIYSGSFSDPDDKKKVSFKPFYEKIRNKIQEDALLPSPNGYSSVQNAYWASSTQLTQLFSNEQLGRIVENPDACWVFTSLSREEIQRNNRALFNYIDLLVRTNINEDVIISGRSREYYYNRYLNTRQSLENVKGISGDFIEEQSFEWLHKFYKWLSETKHRTEISGDKPIFLDQNKKAVSAIDKTGQFILFLPVKEMVDVGGFHIVHPKLLENTETKNFIEQIGIKPPSLKDQIYNIILPQYQSDGEIDTDSHFKTIFEYYCKCSNEEVDEFIALIRDYEFLTYYEVDGRMGRGKADSMYLPSSELKAFFETKKDTRFINLDKYHSLVDKKAEKQLLSFFAELGVNSEIKIFTKELDYPTPERRLPYRYSTRKQSWEENVLDGCKEIVEYIHDYQDEAKSIVLWDTLLRIIKTRRSLNYLLRGKFNYFYRSPKCEFFTASDTLLLREKAWIMNDMGKFVTPGEIFRDTLSDSYDLSSEYVGELFDFLEIRGNKPVTSEPDSEEDANLTDEQKEKIEFANKIKALGINEDDLADLLEFKRQREKRQKAAELQNGNNDKKINASVDISEGTSNTEPVEREGLLDKILEPEDVEKLDKATSRVVKDIVSRTKEKPSRTVYEKAVVNDESETDSDEYMPITMDYSQKIEKAKQKSAAEIDKIAYLEELQNKVLKHAKYSYGWFSASLEMESINSGESNANSKEISISFAKVEREAGTTRTLILKHPDRYIPQSIEELADIPLILHMQDQTKTVPIEVASVKSYTLRVKMKDGSDIDDIDLTAVKAATIDAKSPVFLLEELRKQFLELGYEDEFNMQENLCENIEFVFGPPGTGKTTYLAKNVLLPLMQQKQDCKVLVLTPTNKSADVLVHKMMEVCDDDDSYNEWLVRFGVTSDESIEQSPVYKEKTYDIRTASKNVTVTTIARFPYDYFMPQGARVFLNGINWDYIVIDEASMIPIANIVYPLYKKKPKKFIIAGDPLQIEPIAASSIWKDENIFRMIHLDSFVDYQTVPHAYEVKLLTTQYRSIPEIGEVFSEFSYGGILKHARTLEEQKKLYISDMLPISTLNLIKFPISKYESIYRPKRLQGKTPYQIYSALFTFEYVDYLVKELKQNEKNLPFSIGVIAPYKAQADLIDKLLSSVKTTHDVTVQVGTIHSFQGDECDMIIAVFNPPPALSTSKEMFLNKQNIINVSISRARDYLVVLMPDDDTDNIENLKLINRIEALIKKNSEYKEYGSHEIEKLIFGDSNYLEDNSFSTCHQMVNVYGLPEKKYEIRSEDTAIDIQIHEEIKMNGVDTIAKGSKKNGSKVDSTKGQNGVELVFSNRYGRGQILRREKTETGTNLVVKFEKTGEEKQYDEKRAFLNGGLIKL